MNGKSTSILPHHPNNLCALVLLGLGIHSDHAKSIQKRPAYEIVASRHGSAAGYFEVPFCRTSQHFSGGACPVDSDRQVALFLRSSTQMGEHRVLRNSLRFA